MSELRVDRIAASADPSIVINSPLNVSSTPTKLTMPIWTTATRPTSSLLVGQFGYNSTTGTSEMWDGTFWVPLGSSVLGKSAAYPAASAAAIKAVNPNAPSGIYYINWGGTVYPIYCEMELEGGGWMMILNYVHRAGTTPSLNVRTNSFPMLGSQYTLGVDEQNSIYWGHTGNTLTNAYNWQEFMFYGRSSNHSRVIHFLGNNANIRSYMKTGAGGMNSPSGNYRDTTTIRNGSLRVNASLPFFVDADVSGYTDQGDLAMTNFPMYGNSTIGNPRAHWGINGGGNRWEMDDSSGDSGVYSTIHRIWVR